jgi:hypothetical protein
MYLALIQDAADHMSAVVLPEHAELPMLKIDLTTINPAFIEKLVPEVGTLSVLCGKLPAEFIETTRFIAIEVNVADRADDISSGLQAGQSSIEKMQLPVLVDVAQACRAEIRGTLVRVGDANLFVFRFRNYSEQSLEVQQIAFGKNFFGFAPGQFTLPPSVGSQKSPIIQVSIVYSEACIQDAQPSAEGHIAVLVNKEKPIFFTARTKLDLILIPADQGSSSLAPGKE